MEPKRALPYSGHAGLMTTVPKLDDIRKKVEEKKKELGFTRIFKPKEAGVTVHDMPATVMDILDANDQLEVHEDDTDYTVVPLYLGEISDLYHKELGMKEAKGGGVIPLAVLAREMKGNAEWGVPDKQVFLDLIAHLHSVTVRGGLLNRTLEWNNFWFGWGAHKE